MTEPPMPSPGGGREDDRELLALECRRDTPESSAGTQGVRARFSVIAF